MWPEGLTVAAGSAVAALLLAELVSCQATDRDRRRSILSLSRAAPAGPAVLRRAGPPASSQLSSAVAAGRPSGRRSPPTLPRPSRAAPQAFYALCWRPRRAAWNAQPCSPHAPARLDAADLFRRFVAAGDAIPELTNLSAYISLWFQGTPLSEVRRGNMEELMAYGGWRAVKGRGGCPAGGLEGSPAGPRLGLAPLACSPYLRLEIWRAHPNQKAPIERNQPTNQPTDHQPGFWYRTPEQMAAAGMGHVPAQMVDQLEVAWRHTFPPGYTKVGGARCGGCTEGMRRDRRAAAAAHGGGWLPSRPASLRAWARARGA
jgi:hypothetical protein